MSEPRFRIYKAGKMWRLAVTVDARPTLALDYVRWASCVSMMRHIRETEVGRAGAARFFGIDSARHLE